jgi:hypothetical protein
MAMPPPECNSYLETALEVGLDSAAGAGGRRAPAP